MPSLLVVAASLTATIDSKTPICASSEVGWTFILCLHSLLLMPCSRSPVVQEEVEVRAASIVATERICDVLNRVGAGRVTFPIQVDWMLWQEGEDKKDDIPPHHRTLSCFY